MFYFKPLSLYLFQNLNGYQLRIIRKSIQRHHPLAQLFQRQPGRVNPRVGALQQERNWIGIVPVNWISHLAGGLYLPGPAG